MPNGNAAADAFDPEPEQEQARPKNAPRDPKAGRQASGAATARSLQVLGVGANASLDAVNTAYFTFIKRFPGNPTEEDEARLQEVKRAYDLLRRSYQPKVEKQSRFHFQVDKRIAMPLMGLASIALLAGLVAFNWNTIRLRMVHYQTGTVLSLKGQATPFGQVIGYESVHHFDTGNPSGAYQLRLQQDGHDVWVGERLVVNGMTPIAAAK